MITQDELETMLGELLAGQPVPGAVVGLSHAGRHVTAAHGIANVATGSPMTPGTRFLPGSITKVWVASAVLRLVDAGRLTLDAPMAAALPGVRLGGLEDEITVRHLLTHSSGLDAADLIVDVGRGDEATARYVELLSEVGRLHQPGAWSSYCNAGFVLAGRILELATGQPFRLAMRELLLDDADLPGTVLTPEEAVLAGLAVGHFPADGGLRPTDRLLLPEGLAAAGATLFSTAEDLLSFADLHLAGGFPAMAEHQLDLPVPELGSMGLGWFREQRGEDLVLSHTGGSLGGQALLLLVPGRRLAVTAYVNSTAAAPLVALREVLLARFGVAPARDLSRPQVASDERLVGTYRRCGVEVCVRPGPVLRMASELPLVREYLAGQPVEIPGEALEGGALGIGGTPVAYLVGPEQEYLYLSLRLAARV